MSIIYSRTVVVVTAIAVVGKETAAIAVVTAVVITEVLR